MRKNKIIKFVFLIGMAMLLSGCDMKFEMSIINNNIEENIIITGKNDDNSSFLETMDSMMREYQTSSDKNLKIKKTTKNNFTTYRFNYKEKLSSFSKSDTLSVLKGCYDKVNVLNYDNKYLLSTSNSFLCYDYYEILEKVTIDIYTNHIVLYHNADEVKNSHYIWHINKENAENKTIQLEFEASKYNNGLVQLWLNIKKNIVPIMIVLILLILGIGFIVKKYRRVNKI